MKRFHVNIAVKDIDRSIEFYRTLFGTEPDVVKDDYAKWMLEDPRVDAERFDELIGSLGSKD